MTNRPTLWALAQQFADAVGGGLRRLLAAGGRQPIPAIRACPHLRCPFADRGLTLAAAGRWTEAARELDRAIERDPANAELLYHRGVARQMSGDPVGAAADLAAAARLNPALGPPLAVVGGTQVGSTVITGSANPEPPAYTVAAVPPLAPRYAESGWLLLENHDWEGAIREFDRATQADPGCPGAHTGRGIARLFLGEDEAAVRDLDAALSLDSRDGQAVAYRAHARHRLGQLGAALADYDLAARLAPDLAWVFTGRGAIRLGGGDWSGALADLDESARLEPSGWAVFNDRAWLLATCPDPAVRDGQRAVGDAFRACELTGWATPTALGTLAAALAETGVFGEAVLLLERALADPTYLEMHGDIGQRMLAAFSAGNPYRSGEPKAEPLDSVDRSLN